MLRNRFVEQALRQQLLERRVSRRTMIRTGVVLGAAAMSGGLFAGCGDLSQRLEERRAEREAAAVEEDIRDFPELEVTNINGVDLAVWDSGGDGDPVVFIHGGMGYEVWPLLTEPALTEQFRLIHYNRRGWGDSPQADEPTTMEERAADCHNVMAHFRVERAHIQSLSAGGPIALQLARDFPDAVQSLALLEPALVAALPEDAAIIAAIGEAVQRVDEGDLDGAVDVFAGEVVGEDHLEAFDQNMPNDWFERWAEEMETIFFYDLPGEAGWTFGEEEATDIDQPVLNVMGGDSPSYWQYVFDHVADLFPQAENVVVPNAPHTMPGAAPAETAQQLAAFFARHPIDG